MRMPVLKNTSQQGMKSLESNLVATQICIGTNKRNITSQCILPNFYRSNLAHCKYTLLLLYTLRHTAPAYILLLNCLWWHISISCDLSLIYIARQNAFYCLLSHPLWDWTALPLFTPFVGPDGSLHLYARWTFTALRCSDNAGVVQPSHTSTTSDSVHTSVHKNAQCNYNSIATDELSQTTKSSLHNISHYPKPQCQGEKCQKFTDMGFVDSEK